MKDILHSLIKIEIYRRFLWALPMLVSLANAADVAFEHLDERNKRAVAADIKASGVDVGFMVTYESCSGYKWYRDETCLPLAASFGLSQANCMFSSDACGCRMTNGLVRCYVYGADEYLCREDFGQHGSGFYNGAVFDDCVCRLLLLKPQREPIRTRFRPFRSRSKLSSPGLVEWNSVWDYEIRPGVKAIDKQRFLSVFSNNVYKISGGIFAVKKDVASEIVELNFMRGCRDRSVDCRIVTNPRFGDIVVLDGREISETVYWLWNRKGKVDEYANFIKSHPELFEPIADVSEFKTELGKRLLGTWK